MSDLVDIAGSILRQPNVWVAFALLCVASMPQVKRLAERGDWSRDRLYAGRVAVAALSLALAVTLARATPGLSVRWRGCDLGPGFAIGDPEATLNALMLVPWGVAAAYALRRFWPAFAIGVAASALIEGTQGLLGNGLCDTGDVVLNVAGAALGSGVGVVLASVYGTPARVTGR